MHKRGFGFFGLIITLGLIAFMTYYMLLSFKNNTALLVPQGPNGTTPIQAAQNAQNIANLQQKTITNAVNQAQNAAKSVSK
jgi:hypothetical protein